MWSIEARKQIGFLYEQIRNCNWPALPPFLFDRHGLVFPSTTRLGSYVGTWYARCWRPKFDNENFDFICHMVLTSALKVSTEMPPTSSANSFVKKKISNIRLDYNVFLLIGDRMNVVVRPEPIWPPTPTPWSNSAEYSK